MLGDVDGELDATSGSARAGRPTGSARCGPTSCWATTRGSATGCTPTTATPAGSPSTAWSRPAIRTSSPSRTSPAHRPSALLLFEADEPDHVEDVTGFEADTKIAALLEHRSQYRSTMYIEPDDDGEQLAAFRKRVFDRLAEGGARAGVEYAELFKAITEL